MTKQQRIIITGSESGLGKILEQMLIEQGHKVAGWDKQLHPAMDVANPGGVMFDGIVQELGGLDILINCAGVNKINWLKDVSEREWDSVMDTNAKGIFRMTQLAHKYLAESGGTVLNIVSNAAHMPMRCSAAYNASKGAALILTKQLARELISDGITVFSVSPNKLSGTGMSNDIDQQVVKTRGWTVEQAQEYQLAGLLTGEETDPRSCAEFIAFLLSSKERHKPLAGCDLPYGL